MTTNARYAQDVIEAALRDLRMAIADTNLHLSELAETGNGVQLGTVGPHTAERLARILRAARR
ncbi:hypothetical protein [Streptomyces sp. x-19]|uniref:hypothetical protein n=1 Tax=Streptomyces sp. x-19 TaxID=2789280 RepID=UPI00398182EB